jgi:DNA-binding protein H-NS
MTKKLNLDSMSVDEMWQLHEEIGRVLSVRLTSEKRELEKRLERLRRDKQVPSLRSSNGMKDLARAPRRKYPRVYPKYQNPQEPSETWSGRGKTPRWLVSALKTGHKLEEFAINNPVGILVRKQKNMPNAR